MNAYERPSLSIRLGKGRPVLIPLDGIKLDVARRQWDKEMRLYPTLTQVTSNRLWYPWGELHIEYTPAGPVFLEYR